MNVFVSVFMRCKYPCFYRTGLFTLMNRLWMCDQLSIVFSNTLDIILSSSPILGLMRVMHEFCMGYTPLQCFARQQRHGPSDLGDFISQKISSYNWEIGKIYTYIQYIYTLNICLYLIASLILAIFSAEQSRSARCEEQRTLSERAGCQMLVWQHWGFWRLPPPPPLPVCSAPGLPLFCRLQICTRVSAQCRQWLIMSRYYLRISFCWCPRAADARVCLFDSKYCLDWQPGVMPATFSNSMVWILKHIVWNQSWCWDHSNYKALTFHQILNQLLNVPMY